MNPQHITVVGAGSWGTTVASLTSTHNPTLLWARSSALAKEIDADHTNSVYLPELELPETLRATDDLAAAVSKADVLVVAVPSHGARQVLEAASSHVRRRIPVVSLTKGLEQGTLSRMTQVIGEVLPGHPAGVLTGPNLAREIMEGHAAVSVVGIEDPDIAERLQDVFSTGSFRVYTNDDVIGCEIGGSLKNVIAIASGMAQALAVGDNTRAAVMTRGLSELTRVGMAMGGKLATFAGITGMGDLLATCMSPQSRNRRLGEELGKGRKLDDILGETRMIAEGVRTADTVMELAARHHIELPICEKVHGVLTGHCTPREAYDGLLARRLGHETRYTP